MDLEEGNPSKKMRIYVGGLGETMTEDDLRRLFQGDGGGVVDSIDIIRNKSRNFAYVDFVPSSQNSLSKLFSIYNGCAWKGGKLRLEKAKEHYIIRLRREWKEDAQLTNGSDGANLEISAPESAEKVAKSEQIQIFFPRLGEVKSLPISGTGTHRYSFPHVEVPPLPVHFCDCEEHNISAPTHNSKDTKKVELDAQIGGIDEEEISIMNAVMNKLFERQKTSETNNNETMTVIEEDNSTCFTDYQQTEDNKVDSDDDNLVLNVKANDSNTKIMPLDFEIRMISKAHGSSKVEKTKMGPFQVLSKDLKRKDRVQNKKRKSMLIEFDRNEHFSSFATDNGIRNAVYESASHSGHQPVDPTKIHTSRAQKSSWKALISDRSTVAFSISDILPSVPSAGEEEQPKSEGLDPSDSTPKKNGDFATDAILESESEEMESVKSLSEAQNTISNDSLNKGRGSSWLQKSSWTQLVSEKNNSFSIDLIFPSSTSEKHKVDSNVDNVNYSTGSTKGDLAKQDEQEHGIVEADSAALVIEKEDTAAMVKKNQQTAAVHNNEGSTTHGIERNIPQQTRSLDVEGGKTCPFMRDSRSLAEWAKIKAALTGGSKKKKQRR